MIFSQSPSILHAFDGIFTLCNAYVLGWWDVGYSFMVGEDGNVYEGRGWDQVGAHTYGYNTVGLGKGACITVTNNTLAKKIINYIN